MAQLVQAEAPARAVHPEAAGHHPVRPQTEDGSWSLDPPPARTPAPPVGHRATLSTYHVAAHEGTPLRALVAGGLNYVMRRRGLPEDF